MAVTGTIEVPGYRCFRCGHVWQPKNKLTRPTTCPRCRSPYWDRPAAAKRVR